MSWLILAAALAACAQSPPDAQRFARPAAGTAPSPAHGYSVEARRTADCLATYPGYDPATDQIVDSAGELRRCPF